MAGQAQEKAQDFAGQARERVQTQVDQRSTEAGQTVSQKAEDLRAVASELRNRGDDGPARAAEQAADRVQRFGSYLEEADGQRILDDVEEFGRRQPWIALAGGVALGIAAARFLKASSSERYQRRTPSQSSPQVVSADVGTTASSYGGENPAGPGYGGATPPVEPVGTTAR
ncbi:MAG TPA: hypothetical protein VKA89_06930 [Solirubrobacterales bacterium]|nr:hypothetical protein [Solirubrobacterales bacterium]